MTASSPLRLRELLLKNAAASGFPLAETIDIEAALPALQPHIVRYAAWVSDGKAGEMGSLERGRDRRSDPRIVMPGAESMLCVALPYPRAAAGARDPSEGPRYARY